MTLDLRELTADWNFEAGEICARTVVGRDGVELLQLRVDLGVMQMFPDGRPDGSRYRGLPTALDYFRHEQRLGREELEPDDWRELERELHQVNYRRLAVSSLVEDCLGQNEPEAAGAHIRRALRDIDSCLERIEIVAESPVGRPGPSVAALAPTLVFHRGRLRVQRAVLDAQYEQAIEDAGRAAEELGELLAEIGVDEEQREEDPGILFLRDLAQRLRREYSIEQTLRERLDEAIENEDFEAAARLRDELRQRQEGQALDAE